MNPKKKINPDEPRPTHHASRFTPYRAFSLVELVIVIVIIGIIAAIAVPRFSAATGNAETGSVQGSLIVLRNAIDLYTAEHSNDTPTGLPDQLLQTTDISGATTGSDFGPYLRAEPANPLNANSKSFVNAAGAAAADSDCAAGIGWVYDQTGDKLYACEGDGTASAVLSATHIN